MLIFAGFLWTLNIISVFIFTVCVTNVYCVLLYGYMGFFPEIKLFVLVNPFRLCTSIFRPSCRWPRHCCGRQSRSYRTSPAPSIVRLSSRSTFTVARYGRWVHKYVDHFSIGLISGGIAIWPNSSLRRSNNALQFLALCDGKQYTSKFTAGLDCVCLLHQYTIYIQFTLIGWVCLIFQKQCWIPITIEIVFKCLHSHTFTCGRMLQCTVATRTLRHQGHAMWTKSRFLHTKVATVRLFCTYIFILY